MGQAWTAALGRGERSCHDMSLSAEGLVEQFLAREQTIAVPVPPSSPCCENDLQLARCEERFDLVFIDPPYDLGLAAPACEALEALGLLKPDARIYVESRRHDAAPAVPESWERLREKDGGDVRAQLYRKE